MQMTLPDLVRCGKPQPWGEGDNIPWNDPEFSRRMLKVHLSQEHDAASRRAEIIDRHARFIHETVLGGEAGSILDLGCGPGLYVKRLARLGHACRGIDYSPASIEYARQTTEQEGLDCAYLLSDVRAASFGPDQACDLVMMVFGEFNVFSPADAHLILSKAYAALKPGGKLLLEYSTEESVQEIGKEAPVWYTETAGLFSDHPHLMLRQSAWDAGCRAAVNRHIVIDAETAAVTRYTVSYQAYSQDELRRLLQEIGFAGVTFYPSLTGEEDGTGFLAVVAKRA